MTSLTQVAIVARKTIRYGIYGIIFLLVGKMALDAGVSIYKKLFPAPPPAPTVKYGKLPKLTLPASLVTDKISYVLETPDGGFPTLPDQAKVYFMPKANANLLALDVAKEKAKSLGFSSDAQSITDTIYKFKNINYPTTLEMNIVSGTFSVSYDLNSDRTPLDYQPPAPEVAASEFRGFLSNADLLPEDLTGTTGHDFLKLSGGKFVSAISLSESNVVKINLFRKDYDGMPCVTKNPTESNVWAILGGADDKNQKIIASEYHYHPVDESQYSTYPIKTPEEAFTELQSGQGVVVNKGVASDISTMKIRKVYLAYFDPEDSASFMEPIYVFEGDKGFTAYLPAVTPDYYGE